MRFKNNDHSRSLNTLKGVIVLSMLLLGFTFISCNTKRPSQKNENTSTADSVFVMNEDDTASAAVKIAVAKVERYGKYLTDAEGRALYLFTADMQGESSACYGNCAETWPPLLTTSEPVVADTATAINAEMLGTIIRKDSSLQVTYNGWPLYYFKKDEGEGMVKGQDVHGFGGEWYLISPKGTVVEAEGS